MTLQSWSGIRSKTDSIFATEKLIPIDILCVCVKKEPILMETNGNKNERDKKTEKKALQKWIFSFI